MIDRTDDIAYRNANRLRNSIQLCCVVESDWCRYRHCRSPLGDGWRRLVSAEVLEFAGRAIRVETVGEDPRDEFILELAVAAGCEAIVTHNVRDFAGADRFAVDILTPGAFLGRLRMEQS